MIYLRKAEEKDIPKLYEYEVITVIRGVCHRKIGGILPPLIFYTLEKLQGGAENRCLVIHRLSTGYPHLKTFANFIFRNFILSFPNLYNLPDLYIPELYTVILLTINNI